MLVLDDHGIWHEVSAQLVEDFAVRGLVWREGPVMRIKQQTINELQTHHPHLAMCDFCQARPVAWDIVCDDFTISDYQLPNGQIVPYESVNGWAACETCGSFIDAKESAQLFQRAVERFGNDVAFALARVHEQFWQHYRSATRIPPKTL